MFAADYIIMLFMWLKELIIKLCYRHDNYCGCQIALTVLNEVFDPVITCKLKDKHDKFNRLIS